MRTINFTPRKNVVRYQTRMTPSTIIVDGVEVLREKTQKLNKPTVLIYKHSDGYESGTLPQLEEFHKLFLKERGYDYE